MLASPNFRAYTPTGLPTYLPVWSPQDRPQDSSLPSCQDVPLSHIVRHSKGVCSAARLSIACFLSDFGEQKFGCVGFGGSDGIAGTEFEECGLGGERSEEAKHDAGLGKQAIGEGHPMEGRRLSVSGGRRVRQRRGQQPQCSVETDNVHQPVREDEGWSSGDFVTGNN